MEQVWPTSYCPRQRTPPLSKYEVHNGIGGISPGLGRPAIVGLPDTVRGVITRLRLDADQPRKSLLEDDLDSKSLGRLGPQSDMPQVHSQTILCENLFPIRSWKRIQLCRPMVAWFSYEPWKASLPGQAGLQKDIRAQLQPKPKVCIKMCFKSLHFEEK